MTRSDVLRLLKIGRATLGRWIRAKKFPAPLIMGDRVQRWRRDVIEAYVDARTDAKP